MRTRTFEDQNRIDPARTMALATAIAVHVGALLFLIAPSRPSADVRFETAVTEVTWIEPMIPSPPPPPRPAPRDPDPPVRPQRPEPRPDPPRLPESAQTDIVDTRVADNDIVSDEPSEEPVTPAGPPSDTFSGAHADARYGDDNRVRYPRTALRNREQGEVQLRVLIARDGRAIKVELARSSGSRDLDREAQRAVLKWRFVAAERNGEKIESWAVVPIRFDLQQI
jgi:protein TonB